MTRGKRQQLIIVLAAIGVAWAAGVVLEVLLLAERAPLAVGVTTVVAAVAAMLLGRRIAAAQKRASITLQDLRRARRI